ncbi:uncharacterized membrane protein HdeD (DUF308 family) [Arthrobacter stackebrandtii]|uniref:Uncharacterized membrane protein HdeD (DUF308 family) n=1 Tax=Arthrobacter stackebrandtii TaxID=272161 RepID=A0ABS4YXC9_9MICC|nr:hypothetical protein [Arthrobacter stackebrandtii]MBP2412648.1 uncharacterized membrane protein HdeD (DUF308 family) [Arthrobacter stackebrandtii]PYG98805.1 hypothetical protein CVV67_18665 [Arthrobacter stackebrandtii]
MTETALPQPSNASTSASGSRPVWQPVLLRALVTLAFGLTTVFWGNPGTVGLCVSVALYFLALAASHYWVLRTLDLPRGDSRRMAIAGAVGLLSVSAVVAAVSLSAVVTAWLAGAALAVMGAAELFAGMRKRTAGGGRPPLRGDWIISGALGLGTGLLLPFFAAAGPHAILGVMGGGAMMTGALWTLSALTLRHDGGKAKAA